MHYGTHEQLRGPMLQNERIKELAEQSGLVFERDYLRYEELLFAELIVKQCMTIAIQNGAGLTAQAIAQHFGVEE
jgi:hypothetical protein